MTTAAAAGPGSSSAAAGFQLRSRLGSDGTESERQLPSYNRQFCGTAGGSSSHAGSGSSSSRFLRRLPGWQADDEADEQQDDDASFLVRGRCGGAAVARLWGADEAAVACDEGTLGWFEQHAQEVRRTRGTLGAPELVR
jgi:hypothetical protein